MNVEVRYSSKNSVYAIKCFIIGISLDLNVTTVTK